MSAPFLSGTAPFQKPCFLKTVFIKWFKEVELCEKRILSFFLVLCLTLGLLPSAALASGTVQPVSSPEDFAAMDPSGNYILTSDITVSAPYGHAFSGSFDGGGHKVTLAISGDSKLGLFSELSSGATIHNIITDGSVSGTDQVGGIAGLSAGTIENCLNTASVTASSEYAAGIAGQCIGGSITSCGNTGSVALSGGSATPAVLPVKSRPQPLPTAITRVRFPANGTVPVQTWAVSSATQEMITVAAAA